MILFLVGTALVLQSQLALRTVTAETDGALAEASAETGVAEVLALLELGQRGTLAGSNITGAGSYSYVAEEVDAQTYVVRSEATVGDVTRAIEVTIGTEAEEPYALFVDSWGVIDSNLGIISGRVVSNGPLSVSGTTLGDTLELHGPSASCSGCTPTSVFDDPFDVPPPTAPSGTQNCPSNGRFRNVVDGGDGTPFYCTTANVRQSTVRFTGAVTIVNPPLIVYVETGLDVAFDSAAVNVGGASDDFVLLAAGDDDYWWMDSYNSTIVGQLYGPGRDALLENTSIVGQVSTGVLRIASPNNVWISPSALPAVDEGGWTVTRFERVPAN